MAKNSFLLKGWAITILAAIFILAEKEANIYFLFMALIPLLAFWGLDSFYLQLERKYRMLFKKICKEDSDITFSLDQPKANKLDKTLYHQALFSKTEVFFYVPLIIAIIVIFFIIQCV